MRDSGQWSVMVKSCRQFLPAVAFWSWVLYNSFMSVSHTIREALSQALAGVGITAPADGIPLEFPGELAHGDYASGVALAKAKEAGMNPRALAEKLVADMGIIECVARVEIAGPGFINFTLAPSALADSTKIAFSIDGWGKGSALKDQRIVMEYTDPNPFKAFHIGHLMSNTIGESLARITEYAGAQVVRANYQGDVGVHVACAIWGIQKLGIHPNSADEFGTAYAAGATAYKEDEVAKAEIDAMNQKIYDRTDSALNQMYDTGRAESLAAFEKIYSVLGTKFDRYYFESETAQIGKDIVQSHPDIFPESDGARVFKGEEYGLHTRVFLSSKGLPTYEAKELGLGKIKQEEYPNATRFVIVTANEVTDYFRVVKKAMELVLPEFAKKLLHVPHGIMKLPSGKMSSRTGAIITGESLLTELANAASERESRADDKALLAQQVAVGAIKFQILRQGSGKDIIFDRERALSLEGDSGPYLQYAHARCNAILEKAKEQGVTPDYRTADVQHGLTVARLVHRFPEVVASAVREMEPHVITTYLIQLAGAFNSWYAQEQFLDGTPAAAHKVALTDAVRVTLKNGLWLLGIPASEKM